MSPDTRTSSALTDLPVASGRLTAGLGVYPLMSLVASPVRCLMRNVPSCATVKHVALVAAFESLTAEHEAVVVGVIARLEQRERTLGGVVTGRSRGRIPVDARGPAHDVEALPHRHERDARFVVGILSALTAVETHFPASWRLRRQRNDK